MLQSQDRGVTGFTDSCSIPKAAVCQALCGATNLVCEGEKLDPAFSLSLKLFLLIAKTTYCYMCTNEHGTMNILRRRLSENARLYAHI